MSDRFQLEEAVRRGDAAATLLRSELIEEFLNRVEVQFFNRWRGTPAEAKEEREEIFRQMSALSAMRTWLDDLVRTGGQAKDQLKHLMEQGQA